jgi:hypothetical protein
MVDADKASSTELLTRNIPSSLPANLASAAEGVSLFRRLESGAKTCILPAIAVAINKRPLAPIQAAYPNVR